MTTSGSDVPSGSSSGAVHASAATTTCAALTWLAIGEADGDVVAARFDRCHGRVATQGRPAIGRQPLQQRHGGGGRDDAGVGLVQHLGVDRDVPRRPAGHHLRRSHLVEVDVAHVHRLAVRLAVDHSVAREQIDAAGDVHTRLAALRFDLAPCVVRETRQSDVVRRVVAVADDPAVIVRGTVMVAAEVEPFEADHRLAGACGEPCGGTADAAEADDGDVVALHGIAP